MLLNRTLWLIESRLGTELSLNGIAAELGVNPAYLTRAFSTVLGTPLMRYVRARRVARGAELLVAGASVTDAALTTGYGSPEAFARAFRAETGVPPRDARGRGLDGLSLTRPKEFMMQSMRTLLPPKIEVMPDRRIVGLSRRYTMETRRAIPAQWGDYNEAGFEIDGAVPDAWYGVCTSSGPGGDFDYLCGQEAPRGAVPKGWSAVVLPAGRWARFVEPGHISRMDAVWSEIFGQWMGQEGLAPREGPFVEFYPLSFDGMTGEGGFEIWMPVA
jgi:AraC family transcriptional regulator